MISKILSKQKIV